MSEHDQPVAANVLDRDFTATAPNQRWVGDTTELLTSSGTFRAASIRFGLGDHLKTGQS